MTARIETAEATILAHIDTDSVPEWKRKAIAFRFLRRFEAWERESAAATRGEEVKETL